MRIWEDLKIWSERASRQVGNGSKFQASALSTTSLEWTRFLPRSSGISFIFEDAREGEIPNQIGGQTDGDTQLYDKRYKRKARQVIC